MLVVDNTRLERVDYLVLIADNTQELNVFSIAVRISVENTRFSSVPPKKCRITNGDFGARK